MCTVKLENAKSNAMAVVEEKKESNAKFLSVKTKQVRANIIKLGSEIKSGSDFGPGTAVAVEGCGCEVCQVGKCMEEFLLQGPRGWTWAWITWSGIQRWDNLLRRIQHRPTYLYSG